jgi:putative drug exporter of the RND superfamily
MELLGDRNWWLPRWLDRLLPVVHVEAAPDGEGVGVAPTEALPPEPEAHPDTERVR